MRGRGHGRLILAIIMILIMAAGVAGCSITAGGTPKEARKIKKTDVKVKNKDCELMSENPLEKETDSEFVNTVEEYYASLTKKTDYIDAYEEIEVYSKNGLYQGTYVAFVKYGMKIKDIYTIVPGLSTLYVVKDGTSGTYQIHTEELDDRTEAYIEAVAAHQDVQAVMEESRSEYQKAVQSDALLQEALLDLQRAYENSTGS